MLQLVKILFKGTFLQIVAPDHIFAKFAIYCLRHFCCCCLLFMETALQIVVPDIFLQLLQIIVWGRGGRLVRVVRVVRSSGHWGHWSAWNIQTSEISKLAATLIP